VGTKTSALVGPINSGSTSRAAAQQSVFLVKYKGPQPSGGSLSEPYSFVSVGTAKAQGIDVQFVLNADVSTGSVSAAPPAAIPTGSTGSTALEQQVFNIEVVPLAGE